MELRECPDEYYDNCENAIKRCRSCAAGGGKPNGKVYYDPLQPGIGTHPYQYARPAKPLKDKLRSATARSARKSERVTSERLNQKVSRLTAGSGAINGDGDATNLAGERTLRVEKKRRGKHVKSYSVTAEEFRKGLQQKIDVWEITVEEGETLYLLREDTYAYLLAMANLKEERNG